MTRATTRMLLLAFAAVALLGFAPSRSARAVVPPELFALGPAFAHAGAADFTLTAWGHNFEPNTVIRWNGTPLATTFHSGYDLSAPIPAGFVATPGTHTVTLETPGQAISAPVQFQVRAGPPPAANTDFRSVSNHATNSTSHYLIQGGPFVPGISFSIGGVPLPYRIIGENLVLAGPYVAPATTSGQVNFVFNSGVGTSTGFLSIAAPATTKPPIAAISPGTAKAGGPGFWLSVSHTGQLQGGASVEINGVAYPSYQQDGGRLVVEVPASLLANVAQHEVRTRYTDGTLSDPRTLAVTATGVTSTPFLQPFQSSFHYRADGNPLFFHTGASFAGPNAYVTWNGRPLRVIHIPQIGIRIAVPGDLMANPGDVPLILRNPAPINTTSAPVNYYFYDVADIDCNKAVDGVDVLRVLNDLAGIPNTPAPQFCFPGNPDGLSGYNIADALFIRREIANLNP